MSVRGVRQCVCGLGCSRDFQYQLRNECLVKLIGNISRNVSFYPSYICFKFNICFRISIQGNSKWRSLSINMLFFQIKFYLDFFNILQKISEKFNHLYWKLPFDYHAWMLNGTKKIWSKNELSKNVLKN